LQEARFFGVGDGEEFLEDEIGSHLKNF
jgi:hypothetical protein